MQTINPLDHPICLATPLRLAPSAWLEHVPFGMFLIDLLRPHNVVELGTHRGVSYCGFCQALKELQIKARAYAIDTWKGDEHAGFYGPGVLDDLRDHHDVLYGQFSSLVQSTFDDAVGHFENASIDLLHIDGYHTYASVKHDFETWLPKMSSRGIVLLHDINLRVHNAGVWQLWDELRPQYSHFEMSHSAGLGLLAVGQEVPASLGALLDGPDDDAHTLHRFFHHLGRHVALLQERNELATNEDGQTENAAQQARLGTSGKMNELMTQTECQDRDRDTRAQQVEELTRHVAHLDGDIQSTSLQVAELSRQLADRERDLEIRSGQVADLGRQLADRQRDIRILTERLGDSESRILPLTNALTSLTTQLAERTQALQAITLEATDLRVTFNDQRQEAQVLLQRLKDRERTAEEAIEHASELSTTLLATQHELAESSLRVQEWHEHWTRLQRTKAWQAIRTMRRTRARLQRGLRLLPAGTTITDDGDFIQQLELGTVNGQIERAVWDGNHLEVSGWAVYPAGSKPPYKARIRTDNAIFGETRVHLSRPEIGAQYASHPGAARCGFRFFHRISDQRAVLDGLKEIDVEFVDLERSCTTLHAPLMATHETSSVAPELWTEIEDVLSTFEERTGRLPAILDWHSGLQLGNAFPAYTVFSPPTTEIGPLPYLDKSIDVVVTGSCDDECVSEAVRVASAAMICSGTFADTSPVRQTGIPRSTQHPAALWREGSAAASNVTKSLPSTSIIIPVHNNVAYTQACLDQLAATLPSGFRGEIIVVDDASSDETCTFLEKRSREDDRLRVLRNADSIGFLLSCNKGAENAICDVLLFLNNDTLPQSDWLAPLLRILRDHPDVGAVGGKLVYPNGTLQEAGCIVFSDATGYNFGKFDPDVDAPLYNYVREVDYCSGALLATRRRLFNEIGGFDTRYVPAYYEDADYCFSVRECGFRVYYQPESVVVHFEGVSSGTSLSEGIKHYQVVNRRTFAEKWAATLKLQPAAPRRSIDSATRQLWAVRDTEMGHPG